MEIIEIEKNKLSITLFTLKDLYRYFSIQINNETSNFLKNAKLHTKVVNVFGIKISHLGTDTYIQSNVSKFKNLFELYAIRERYILSYTSLYFSIYKKSDINFALEINNENDRLTSLLNELKATLKYDFHLTINYI